MKLSEDKGALDFSRGLLENSLLYRELKAEHEEILKHKWIESEKVGRDIGYDLAVMDWTRRHRSQWRKQRPWHQTRFSSSGN